MLLVRPVRQKQRSLQQDALAALGFSSSGWIAQYRLLQAFEGTFRGVRYLHRDSSRGDYIAMHLSEDLYTVGRSLKLCTRIDDHERVLNAQNLRVGIKARRGD